MLAKILPGVFLLVVVPAAVLGLLSFFSRRPANLGAKDGRLAECTGTPNCVSTQTALAAYRMEPIAYSTTAEAALAKLRTILTSWPRTKIITETEKYLHAECASLIFRFVDDVEILLDDAAKLIHFRSASRVGRSDLGVNRQRMEKFRAQM